jgi:hypothetical protein
MLQPDSSLGLLYYKDIINLVQVHLWILWAADIIYHHVTTLKTKIFLMAVTMKDVVFWDMMPCGSSKKNSTF